MKTLIVLTLLVASVPAFGQDVDQWVKAGGAIISADQAKKERSALSKAAARYNADQPNVSLRGKRVLFRLPREARRWDDQRIQHWISWMKSAATAIGAIPVWDVSSIRDRIDELDFLRASDEVDQSTLPGKGSIKTWEYVAELAMIEFEKSQEFGGFFGRFWSGIDFEMSRETSYSAGTLTISYRSGETLAVYKNMASASTADNVSGNLAEGFFGSSVGFYSSEDADDARRYRAEDSNVKGLMEVFKQKCK